MQAIELAYKSFFRQFTKNVFVDGEIINDPNNILYPRITFSYSITDAFVSSLTTFQVWDWSFNNERLWKVCNKIEIAVPVEMGAAIDIPAEIYFEHRKPNTDKWVRFEIGEFQSIVDKFAPKTIEWREIKKNSSGKISLWRGNPFLTPRITEEPLSRAMYGTIESRYRSIK